MFEQILHSLPEDPSGVMITVLVAGGIAVGSLAALLGALHGRPTIALAFFGIGALLGAGLPRWMEWDIRPAITIAALGVIFGVLGFVLHRFCVALLLGILVAIVAMMIFYDQTTPLAAKSVQISGTIPQIISDLWKSAPETFRAWAMWLAIGVCAAAGLVGYIFPRVGMAALFSLGGTMLTLASIRLGLASDKITWLETFRTGPMTTAALGMTLLLVGFLVQIALLYRPAAQGSKKGKKENEDRD